MRPRAAVAAVAAALLVAACSGDGEQARGPDARTQVSGARTERSADAATPVATRADKPDLTGEPVDF